MFTMPGIWQIQLCVGMAKKPARMIPMLSLVATMFIANSLRDGAISRLIL